MENQSGMMGLGGGLRGGDGQMLQMLMQRLAPLQQQNPQAYQAIMARIQQRMGGQQMPAMNAMGGQALGGPAMAGQAGPFGGQLAMLQQQNPQAYQAVMQRMSPVGPDATSMNRFPNRAPARFPNPMAGI